MSGIARTFRSLVVALVGAAIIWLGAASSAQALNLIVDTTTDSTADNPFPGISYTRCDPTPGVIDCSLRGALLRANAVPGPHTISVPAGTYTLNAGGNSGANEDAGLLGDLDILQTITIIGAGPDSTVITGDTSIPVASRDRVFQVLPAGNLTITDVSIRAGGAGSTASNTERGGGVWAQGPLTMQRVSVRLNQQELGGGLYIQNATTISDSVINSNTASEGAGIFIDGTSAFSVSILNSTISTNTASGTGGGIRASILNPNTIVTLNNVTVAKNSARFSGGLAKDSGAGALAVRNTIVASNTATSLNNNCSGTIQSQGHNLVWDPNPGGDTCSFGGDGDIVNSGNPLLADLGRYGGPTATHALLSGSAALDAGDPAVPGSGFPACEPNDQRGLPRTIDGDGDGIAHCDIGAAEGGTWYAVNTTDDSNDSSYRACDNSLVPWKCSLRGAISNANGGGGATVITLPATGAGNPYRLNLSGPPEDNNATGDLDLLTGMAIVGGGANTTIVDGHGLDRVFDVRPNGAHYVTLQDLTVQNGNAGASGGGGILVQDLLVLLRVRVVANTARNGGGIFFLSSTDGSRITDSVVSGNTATAGGQGGAGIAQSTSGTLTITNTTIAGNQSATGGGGLLQFGAVTTNLRNVTLAGNSATTSSGGLLQAGTVTVANTIIAGNSGGPSPNCGGSGTPTSLGYNLVFGGGTCGFTATGDKQNGSFDPRLGPLQNNGGPTETMALGAGSAAIDAGNPTAPFDGQGAHCTAADQRGSPRPIDGDLLNGALCDIGAYELQSPYPADLAVSLADAPDPLVLGQPLTYTATVTNTSLATAVGVSLTDTLPAGVAFGSATPSQGSCAGTSTVTCTLGTLSAAASATVTIVVTPSQGGSLSNTASVSAQLPDPTPANNAATATSTVLAATALSFNAQPGSALAGAPLNPQPVVRVLDQNGTAFSAFSGPVTLALGANPGGATLGGTTTVNAVNGVATFTNVSVSAVGAGYTLVASSGALTTATSTPFTSIGFCTPRPNVRVTTAVSGGGQLSATLAAQTSAGTPANGLSSVRITAIANASVRLNGSPIGVGQTVALPAGTQQATLLLQRQTGGQASTVAFAVVDGCGEWKSFVGGGPSAF